MMPCTTFAIGCTPAKLVAKRSFSGAAGGGGAAARAANGNDAARPAASKRRRVGVARIRVCMNRFLRGLRPSATRVALSILVWKHRRDDDHRRVRARRLAALFVGR